MGKSAPVSASYNARIFSGGIRRQLHEARFRFLAAHVPAGVETVFELGCFDGRAIEYLKSTPRIYVGADAGWEGGLANARQRWKQYHFYQVTNAAALSEIEKQHFDASICMETFEHMSPQQAEEYISLLAKITTGKLIVTVPVEHGPIFLAKHIIKRLFMRNLDDREASTFTLKEVALSTLGVISGVRRVEHKGFDYRWVVATLSRDFALEVCEGLPFRKLPCWLNFTVAIVCRPKST